MALTVLVFTTDQSIVYASGTDGVSGAISQEEILPPEVLSGEQNPESPVRDNPGSGGQDPESPVLDNPGSEGQDPESPVLDNPGSEEQDPVNPTLNNLEPAEQTEEWYPSTGKNALDAETFLFEQEQMKEPEENGPYEASYGAQLSGTTAGELYRALKICWDGEEEQTVSLGEVITEEALLEGEAYDTFRRTYEKAAQNAFDAFWYDETDAQELDIEKSGLIIHYTGEPLKDGTVRWKAGAKWNLFREEAEEPAEEEPVQDALEEEAACVQYLQEAFAEVSEIREQNLQEEEILENADENCARMFKKLCERADIDCILIKGVVDEEAGIWNAVRVGEEDWYLVDIPHGVFLKGLRDQEEGENEETEGIRRLYGDFSNSHMGFFCYPKISLTDYPGLEETETEEPAVYSAEDPGLSATDEMSLQTGTEDTAGGSKPAEEASRPSSAPESAEEAAVPAPQADAYQVAEAAESQARAVPAPASEKALTQVSVSAVKPQTYTGKAITPKVTVKDASTGKTLKVGKQYTLSYENNVNAGTATAVIRGIAASGYDGVLRVNFTIRPQNISKVSSKVIGKKFGYTGQPVTPGVNVSYKKTALYEGKDYVISYVNNVNKGNAQIQLTGTGNFTGTKVLKFKIADNSMKETKVVLSSYSDVYAGMGALPTVTVTWRDQLCRENVDYTVRYPKKLKVGKNYITVKGMGNFKGSVKVPYTISRASLGDAEIHLPYAWQYTGKGIKPLPSSVVVNGATLRAGKDYTIKYQTASGKKTGKVKDAGSYKIILTGKKNYQGTVVFDICVTGDQSVLNQNYNSAQSTIKENNSDGGSVPPDTSPGETVAVEKDRYFGYYEGYKITSKKGIQGVSNYTEDLGAQHVLLNVNMADLISMTAQPGYVPYVYKGKTYYFGDLIALKNTVYYLHGWGGAENPYGANHMRNVTFVLLMGWKEELSWLIHPSARKQGKPYYTLNMQDAAARDTFEALFRYMGEEFGDYKTRVSNWTLGNEVNSCKEWNYSGGMSLNDCVANYAQAFQLLYSGVKRAATSSRVFLSLDHCWTASVAGHSGKSFLDQFAKYMNQTAPGVQWNVNYHPYSQPLNKTGFWSDQSNTTGSVKTGYISMKNIQVLTDYLSAIEAQYGKAGGSIRVILGELGYTARKGNASQESLQAAALGYGYYIAMFNTRIDSYIIRAYLDDPAETKDSLYLGLMDSSHGRKASYEVYKNLDTDRSLQYMNPYLQTVGLDSWESAITGFRADALPASDF